MSKSARSARVASRQRPETLGSGTNQPTNKTIADAESGEIFLINHNSAHTLEIVLPEAKEGAYFRFQFITLMDNNSAKVEIQKPSTMAAGTLKGTIANVVYAGSFADTTCSSRKDAGSATQVDIVDDVHVGSYVECYSDGTNWQFSGVVIGSALGTATFDA